MGRKKPQEDRKCFLSRTKEVLFRAVSYETKGSNTLRKDQSLSVASRSIHSMLQNDLCFQFKKRVSAPMMPPRHLVARDKLASEKLTECLADWYKGIWSDEKKLNLDGPDRFAFYWLRLRKEMRLFRGGREVEIQSCFGEVFVRRRNSNWCCHNATRTQRPIYRL